MFNNAPPPNRLSNEDKLYLRTAAQWAQILSYLIVLFATLIVIDAKRRAAIIEKNPIEFDDAPISNPILIGYFVLAVFIAGWIYVLGKKIETAIALNDSELLANGFSYLKLFVKIAAIGVVVASCIAIPFELIIIASGGF
jgi:hypothetical protein